MRHRINPLVDCVFKDLFGVQEHADLATHFLNALIAPEEPFVELVFENPIIPAERAADDYRVVDVLARDRLGRLVQVEVQLYLHGHLRERMLYGWADIYQGQLQQGDRFHLLRPVISVWILDRNLLRGSERWHSHFEVRSPDTGLRLTDHLQIHVLELPKLRASDAGGLDAAGRWAYFLREARHWDTLPVSLDTPELRRAMSIIERWSDKSRDYRAYQARMNALRVQAEMEESQRELEAGMAQTQAALASAQEEMARVERERARIEREKSQLEQEKVQAEHEKVKAEHEKVKAEKEKVQAEKEKVQAEKEKVQAEKEKVKAEHEKVKAEHERAEVQREKAQIEHEKAQIEHEKARLEAQNHEARRHIDHLRAQLLAAGLDPDAPTRS